MIRLPQNSNCIIYFLFRIDHVMAGLHMYAAFKRRRQWRNFVIFNEDVYVPENITFLKGGSSWHCLYYIQQIRSFKKCKNRGKIHYVVPWPILHSKLYWYPFNLQKAVKAINTEVSDSHNFQPSYLFSGNFTDPVEGPSIDPLSTYAFNFNITFNVINLCS